MRIVVIGGTGFLGARTVRALQQFPDLTVEVASRRGPVVVDITRPQTFEALRGADVVVDVSNGTRSAPDALAAWCLEQGVTLLETTSDAEAVRRLADAVSSKPGPGRVVLGGGLFTGISCPARSHTKPAPAASSPSRSPRVRIRGPARAPSR
jgi:saccharopine dehydrogenase-like NADP-dependent oxidoreductase